MALEIDRDSSWTGGIDSPCLLARSCDSQRSMLRRSAGLSTVDSGWARRIMISARGGHGPLATFRALQMEAGQQAPRGHRRQRRPSGRQLTGANRRDMTQLIPLVDAVLPVRGRRGHPRRRPRRAQANSAYDSEERRELRWRGIEPVLARRNTEHGSGLGVYRWFVERTLSWEHQFRRLWIRWDHLREVHIAWMSLASCPICPRLFL